MNESKDVILIICVLLQLSTFVVATEDTVKNEISTQNGKGNVILCCPWGQLLVYGNSSCVESTIIDEDDAHTQHQLSALKTIGFLTGQICVEKDNLIQNGTLTTNLTQAPAQRFCTNPYFQPDIKTDGAQTLHSFLVCEFPMELTPLRKISAIIMLSSVPFIILTIVMFRIIGSNVNLLHKKSVFCYLISLSVAFLTHSLINLVQHFPPTLCMILGLTAYFAFLASYSWLCVISFNIWSNLESNNRNNTDEQRRTFILNSIFSWGLPSLMLGIMWYFKRATWIRDDYRPIITSSHYCWFSRKKYGKIIFFCTERIILISFNIVMFILTILKIHRISQSLTNSGKYQILVRIFVTMGISWTVEMLACFFSENKIFEYFFIFISIQGYLIFILYMTTEETLYVLKRRYFPLYGSRSEGSLIFRKKEASVEIKILK